MRCKSMVETFYFCIKCKSIYENIDEIICPKCSTPLKEMDSLKHEDIGAFLKEQGFSDDIVKFYSKK